jgi:hypothetical protein
MLGLYNSTLNYLSAVPGSEHYAKFGFRIFYGFWSIFKQKSVVV